MICLNYLTPLLKGTDFELDIFSETVLLIISIINNISFYVKKKILFQ